MSTTAAKGLSPAHHPASIRTQETTKSQGTKRQALDFNPDITRTKTQKKGGQDSSEDQDFIDRLSVILKKQDEILNTQKKLDESFQRLDKNVDLLGAEKKKLVERVQALESLFSLISNPPLRLYNPVVEPSDVSAMDQSPSDC